MDKDTAANLMTEALSSGDLTLSVLEEANNTGGVAGAAPLWSVAATVGCYRMMVRWEYGYTGSCVRRNGNHLNFQIRNWCSNQDVCNLHVVGWWENGPQAGIYNSANGWCAQSRGTFTEIRDAIFRAMVAVGIGAGVAWALSYVAALITIPAFAL